MKPKALDCGEHHRSLLGAPGLRGWGQPPQKTCAFRRELRCPQQSRASGGHDPYVLSGLDIEPEPGSAFTHV